MRIYIAGPMTGLPEFNYPKFNHWAKVWRDRGYDVVNPAELFLDKDREWEYYLKHSLVAMLTCDAIFLMEGWAFSRGAMLEQKVAAALNFTQLFYDDEEENLELTA